jgi:asparagine synthase (glutamine-hydrolysing)
MSGILGFAVDPTQTVPVDRLRSAARSLEERGLAVPSVLLFNDSSSSFLFLDTASGRLRSSSRDLPVADVAAKALLAVSHVFEKDRFVPREQSRESAHGRVFLTFDGVVDNGSELSRELQSLGYNVRPDEPREILLAAFQRWGPDALARVRGSFALAVLHLQRRSLILARDAFGTRPLFYSRPDSTRLFFASRIAALLDLASAAPKVNRTSLYTYLADNMMDHTPETFFAGISQVLPGHYLEAPLDKPSEFSVTCYRSAAPAQTKLTLGQAAQNLRELVVRSVIAQVGEQQSLGAAHSGGFDSSFVIGAFERIHPHAQLQLYTCVPLVKNGAFSQSEEPWADLAATGFRSTVNKVWVSAEGLPVAFASLLRAHEEPFSSPVVFAQLQVFQAAHNNGIRTMLSGQGGDTLFATSADELLGAVLIRLRRGHWGSAAALLRAGAHLPQGSLRPLGRAGLRAVLPGDLLALTKRLARRSDPDWLKKEWFELGSAPPMSGPGLPMLRFEDRNSATCSILNRMPLLTVELQDFVRSLPTDYLVTPNQPIKSIECAALRGLVPDAILARKERSGFPVPVREWLVELAPWVETNMAEISRLPFLEPRRVRQIWDSVRSQKASVLEAFLIWRWIFLVGWLRYLNVRLD